MKRTVIVRPSADRLTEDSWIFWYDDRFHALRCSSYQHRERPTTRHKLRPTAEWCSLRHGIGSRSHPPIPEDVVAEAIRAFCTGIVVKPWE